MSAKAMLKQAGFTDIVKKAATLQGAVYNASNESTNQHVAIKVTNKKLHKNSIAIVENKKHHVNENILLEATILKYLTHRKKIPNSLIKFYNFYECDINYYLIMESGGSDLFDFIKKCHHLIEMDVISMNEWHKAVKIIFNQMIEAIEFIHSHNVIHFDISLENVLINDVQIHCTENVTSKQSKIYFDCKDIQIKLIDFGLSKMFKSTKGDFKSKHFCGKMPYKSPEIISGKAFDAKSNDIWCLGICLFMMVIGNHPWLKAHKSDQLFVLIMNGCIKDVLESWGKMHYVNENIISMFELFFQYENKRASLKSIKNHAWLKD